MVAVDRARRAGTFEFTLSRLHAFQRECEIDEVIEREIGSADDHARASRVNARGLNWRCLT